MKICVLIGEYGEYENHTTMVLGVFSSEAEAWAAIPRIKSFGAEQYALYAERDRRRDEYLKRFEPAMVYPSKSEDPKSPFPQGCTLYTNEQYAEADHAVGTKPAIIPDCDEYRVECFNLDAIEAPQVIGLE